MGRKDTAKTAGSKAAGRKRRRPDGGGAPAARKRAPGNPSYGGYEYQIGVTVWAALDLMLAKQVTDALTVEPRSHEDIEAAIVDPDCALLEASGIDSAGELVIQAKTRSTDPWTTTALADVLLGKADADSTSASKARSRPLEMLTKEPKRRYVFVTNEGLTGSLRPHAGLHLLDFPDVHELPPYTRDSYDAAAQAAIAPRILLCAGVTVELLQARIEQLLSLYGHIAPANHAACIRDLRDAVRVRLTGHAGGIWTKEDVLKVLHAHGGSVLPTRSLQHYVRPLSYEAIRRALDEKHAVIIVGPSGTGKTLTADLIELDMRHQPVPFRVILAEEGPGSVRSEITSHGPVLFHLRDPWGSNRLSPSADRWSNELPKLLRSAGPGHKFLVTSRSDILSSAGAELRKQLAHVMVPIEIEHYDTDRLAEIYDGISGDLTGPASALAKAYRDQAIRTLKRPYEIDRFLDALSREDLAKPRRVAEILAESQIDAISGVIADQVRAWGRGGVEAASVIWAVLTARGALTINALRKIGRSFRKVDPGLGSDLDGMVDFMVAGRNLRRTSTTIEFAHPRVEDGLRMALLSRRADAERVLSILVDTLAEEDTAQNDWGAETALGVWRATSRLPEVELDLSSATRQCIDAHLEALLSKKNGYHDLERALADLALFGSPGHAPSRIARLLLDGGPSDKRFYLTDSWNAPELSAAEADVLAADPRTRELLERFITDVLPFTGKSYDELLVPLVERLGGDLAAEFAKAFDRIDESGAPSMNVGVIVAGLLSGAKPDFNGVIDRIAQAEARVEEWMAREYHSEGRRAEEHEVDADDADHILEEPSERFFNAREGMKAAVRIRYRREGSAAWIKGQPHHRLLAYALADLIGNSHRRPPLDELRILLDTADGWARSHAWRAVQRHWHPAFANDLVDEMATEGLGDGMRERLVEVAAAASPSGDDPGPVMRQAAAKARTERRLEMVCDLMETGLDGDHTGGAARRARAEDLAQNLPAPEMGLARLIIDTMAGEPLKPLGEALTGPIRELARTMLLSSGTALARPLACLAAAADLDVVDTAARLLATDDAEDGEAAVLALRINGSSEAIAKMRDAFKHGRYRVRRSAFQSLTEVLDQHARKFVLAAAKDRSADVRLNFAEKMGEERWSEAIDALIELLRDNRNFGSMREIGAGPAWAEFRVARAAARALGNYDTLPARALNALISAAKDHSSPDPFVACAALTALAEKDDMRIGSLLHEALGWPGLAGAPIYSPIAQTAAWGLFDRAVAKRLRHGDLLPLHQVLNLEPVIAGPLLMAHGVAGGEALTDLLAQLPVRDSKAPRQLVLITAVACGQVPPAGEDLVFHMLAKLGSGVAIDTLDQNTRTRIETWIQELDPSNPFERLCIWIADAGFGLPVTQKVSDPRALKLPERLGVLTLRSLTPAREEKSLIDDGF
jgi:hypothetical protein